jgi:hypothetical protein
MQKIKKDLVDLFELDKLAPEKMNEIVEKLSKIIFQAVLVKTLPLLSEDEMLQYDKIIESQEGGEKLFLFLREKIENFDEIIKEEAEDLKITLAEEFEKVGV